MRGTSLLFTLRGLSLLRGVLMQDRGDVGQIVEHLEGVVDILCLYLADAQNSFERL
jgi:hypothetical protein